MSKIQSNMLNKGALLLKRFYSESESKMQKVQDSKLRNGLLWCVVVLICFSAILLLNYLTPIISDDFAYLFIYGENIRINSLADILQSQINHYYMWGGRSVVHFIAQVLLLIPPLAADVLNSLAYVVYIFLIYYHIKGNAKSSLKLFVLINLAVWFMQPVFGDTILWITGAANYLWGTVLILLFLLPYRLYQGRKFSMLEQFIFSVLLFAFGVLAGWTNENTAGAMILIVLFFYSYYRSVRWKIPVWSVCGLIGAVFGYMVMILAPGNFERAGTSDLNLYLVVYRLFNCALTFFYYCGPLILTCGVVYVLYYHFYKGERNSHLILSIIYSTAAIAAILAMVLSPTFPRRALFGVVTFLIIGMGTLFYNLDFRNSFLRQIRSAIIIIGLCSFIFTYYLAAKEINRFKGIVTYREAEIEKAKNSGASLCVFERYDGNVYIHGEDPFSEELMTRYYGIKIRLKNPD